MLHVARGPFLRAARRCTAAAPPPAPQDVRREVGELRAALAAAGGRVPEGEAWGCVARALPDGGEEVTWRQQDIADALRGTLQGAEFTGNAAALWGALPARLREERWVVEAIVLTAPAGALTDFFRTVYSTAAPTTLRRVITPRVLTEAVRRYPKRLDTRSALSAFHDFFGVVMGHAHVRTHTVGLRDPYYERVIEYLTVAGKRADLKNLVVGLLTPHAEMQRAKARDGDADGGSGRSSSSSSSSNDPYLAAKRDTTRDAGRVSPRLARVIVHACAACREARFVADTLAPLLAEHKMLGANAAAVVACVAEAHREPILHLAERLPLSAVVALYKQHRGSSTLTLTDVVARWVTHAPGPLDAKTQQLLDTAKAQRNAALLEPLIGKLVLSGKVDTALDTLRMLSVAQGLQPTAASVAMALGAVSTSVPPRDAERYLTEYMARFHSVPADVRVAKAYLAALVATEGSKRNLIKQVFSIADGSGADTKGADAEANPFAAAVGVLKRVSKNPYAADILTACGVLSLAYSTSEYNERPLELLAAAGVASPRQDLALLRNLPHMHAVPLKTHGSRLWFDQLGWVLDKSPTLTGRTLYSRALGLVRNHVAAVIGVTADTGSVVLLDYHGLRRLLERYPDALPPPREGYVVVIPFSALVSVVDATEEAEGHTWWARGVPRGHDGMQRIADAVAEYPEGYMLLSLAAEVAINACIRVPTTRVDSLAWAANLPANQRHVPVESVREQQLFLGSAASKESSANIAHGHAARSPPVDPATLQARPTRVISTPHASENLTKSFLILVGRRRLCTVQHPDDPTLLARVAAAEDVHDGHVSLPSAELFDRVFDDDSLR